MSTELSALCRRLKLGQHLVESAGTVQAASPVEYLTEILRQEWEFRQTRIHNRFMKQAGFSAMKYFRDFIFDEVRLPASLTMQSLKSLDFLARRQNLIFYGNVGAGKTHLAIAVGIAACLDGKSVRFFRTTALVNQLVQAHRSGHLKNFLQLLKKTDLLICDEWGYVPLDREGAQLLFQVVADCYETRSMILTTNLDFVKWVNIFYDEKMTAAIVDRLIHHSHLVVFDGMSHRVRNSLMNLR